MSESRLVMHAGRWNSAALLFALFAAPVVSVRFDSNPSVIGGDAANSTLSASSAQNRGALDLGTGDAAGPADEPEIRVQVSAEIAQNRHKFYQIWAEKAHKWVRTALLRLRAGRKLLVKWFMLSKMSEEERDEVQKQVKLRLLAIQSALESLYIEKGTECAVQRKRGGSHGTLAYVYPGQRRGGAFVVHVCNFATEFNGDTSTKTLIHEMSHHMGTLDYAYGEKACLKLKSGEAQRNADTYSEFVYNLKRHRVDDKPYYEEGSGKPHPACNLPCDATVWRPGGGRELELARVPALGQCLHCTWAAKSSGLAYFGNLLMGAATDGAKDSCGDGKPVPRKVESGDCGTEGCAWIDSDTQCLEAAQSLGLPFSNITAGGRAKSLSKPYGCWASDDTLYLNKNSWSEVSASPSESMICSCPSAQEYGSSFTARACCVAYECERP